MPNPPFAKPKYSLKAVIENGDELFKACDSTYEEIASLAKCHVNTVSGALKGKPKQYLKAHNIFTAINIKAFNSQSRASHVKPIEGNETKVDESLEECRVFYDLENYLKSVNSDFRQMAADINVETIVVSDAQKQKPVCESIVTLIKNRLATLGVEVDPDHIVR